MTDDCVKVTMIRYVCPCESSTEKNLLDITLETYACVCVCVYVRGVRATTVGIVNSQRQREHGTSRGYRAK